MTLQQRIAGEVRAELARSNRTGLSLANELGWSQTYMSRRLRGRTPFAAWELVEIARILEVPVSTFFQINGGLMFDKTSRPPYQPGRWLDPPGCRCGSAHLACEDPHCPCDHGASDLGAAA